MKWQEVMTFLSGLGMGAMLVQKNGIIAAINEVGKSFLAMSEGVGTPVPDVKCTLFTGHPVRRVHFALYD